MGDCRMRILVAKETLPNSSLRQDNDDKSDWQAITALFSADTTIADVVEKVLLPLWPSEGFAEHLSLWDCTLTPPRDITTWPTVLYPDTIGPKSKTLFDAGYFPSGTWQVLGKDKTPQVISMQAMEDFQYNLPTAQQDASSLSAPAAALKPSELLTSVTTRFDNDKVEDAAQVLAARREQQAERLEKKRARQAKLEQRIKALGDESSSKKSKVSEQVRRMLIKSRCTGSKSLKMQDRVYLHVSIVHDNEQDDCDDYRYFSRQDTVARVVSTIVASSKNTNKSCEAELLVKQSNMYRRLPVTMRLYEAIEKNFLQEVDAVVVRQFNPQCDEATSSILDAESVTAKGGHSVEEMDSIEKSDRIGTNKDSALACEPTAPVNGDLLERLRTALAEHDSKQPANKKKSSATSEKVRTMLIKSKAKGDKKRVARMDDRFFVELIVAKDDGKTCAIVSASNVFLAKSDQIKRVLRDHVAQAGLEGTRDVQLVSVAVAAADAPFQPVPRDLTFEQAEQKRILANFGRLVVRIDKS